MLTGLIIAGCESCVNRSGTAYGQLTSGLVSYYKLDEANVTDNADDIVGSNDGAQLNSPLVANSIVLSGSSMATSRMRGFVAASSMAFDLGDPASLRLSTFTLSAFVYMSAVPTSGFTRTIMAKSNTAITTTNYLLDVDDTMHIRWFFTSGGASNYFGYTSTGTITVGKLHHVVATWDGTLLKIYIDGALDSSFDPIGTPTPDTTSGNAYIGRLGNETSRYWNGWIDEVGVWNRALSLSEVQQLYSEGSIRSYPFTDPGLATSCVDYWKVDGPFWDQPSSVSGGNFLTQYGDPGFMTGKIGNGVSYNGTDLGVYSTRASYSVWTVSAWVKVNGLPPAPDCMPVLMWRRQLGEYSGCMGVNSTGKIVMYIYDGADKYGTGAVTLPSSGSTWAHVVQVAGDSTNMRLYVNGVLDSAATTSIGGPYNAWSITPPFFTVGTIGANVGTVDFHVPYNGVIDEVGMWNRMLTPSEIAQLYNSGTGLTYPFTGVTAKPHVWYYRMTGRTK